MALYGADGDHVPNAEDPRAGLEGAHGLSVRALCSPLAGPFDLEVRPGEIVVVRGPSGSGKTLFLRLVADLDPGQGEVVLGGRARAAETAPAWRRRAVYVAAEPGWWTPAVADHFAPADRDGARALAARLNVREGAFDAPVARLSTGERQRLAIVRALVLAPPLLILDEPSAALDEEATARLEALLRERAAAGAILLMASHDPAQGPRLGARVLRMVDRRLEAGA
ncbi:MAG: ATP-binding cassette domain-containing protein [Caulobacteraceae bacterium]|nr:ATP-binding cassette domain-containing protein [Caulobacter sp.]